MRKLLPLTLIITLILTACQSVPQATEPPPPPPTEAPTETPPPTDTPVPTATPDPTLFLDEFDGGIAEGWEILNEEPDLWYVTPEGWLAIHARAAGFLDTGDGIRQVNMFTRPAPEGDFVLTTQLIATAGEDFQQAGIFMIQDGKNYTSILNAFCSLCLPDSGGSGILLESFLDGEYQAQGLYADRPRDQIRYYLRLTYSAAEATITGEYALEPDQWQFLGTISEVPGVQMIGIGAANVFGPEGIRNDLMAFFDYIEVSATSVPVRTGAAAPRPTATPAPTETPVPTELPEGILFRDDFDGYLQPGWSWINENPDKWQFVEFDGTGWLEITGDKPGGLAIQANTLSRALPEGDFFDFVSVGLGATNSVPEDWEVEDIVARFDYFEISVP